MNRQILVTGAAGFIGAAVCNKLLANGESIIGIDNLNDYYDPNLKLARLENIKNKNLDYKKLDISNEIEVKKLFDVYKPSHVIHLAAQAGVRYSIENPNSYIQSNLVGFSHILEGCRHHAIKHLVYASSSSVYGGNTNLPFNESQAVNHPVSLYAATKKANELMAHSYSHLYGMPATGLRFFTVWTIGRQDLVQCYLLKLSSQINQSAYSTMEKCIDFTYIDDIVEGVVQVLDKPAKQQGL